MACGGSGSARSGLAKVSPETRAGEQIANLKIRSPYRVCCGATTIARDRGTMAKKEIIIKDTHRALWYEDGKLMRILEAGRYEYDPRRRDFWGKRLPVVEVQLV